ncbi:MULTISPECIES: hypothetical protein [unclassified Bradyrhizobium]|uniref:hypothetical protein n=1 Tax=unclassified Bradyrhizobium TaxID=2631580 RepID=UPI001FF99C07|nr:MULTISPECIES: hypothetical protein [unclassified Bradyrhizobium]MCK1611035.1 hypothetical protein [Bradyrhizobium sp. 163]MCK1762789.1 hypothetical protein [Bradyrhizobium sp. 136]
MTDRAMIAALNDLAGALNEAAAKLDAINRMRAGSALARMIEQGKQFAKIMPQPTEPTKWQPEWPS